MSRKGRKRTAWYRIPVVWVAALGLLAAVTACVVNVAVALQHADTALSRVGPDRPFLLSAPPRDGNR